MAADVPGQMLDDGAYLLAARRLALAQDHHHRPAALHVIERRLSGRDLQDIAPWIGRKQRQS
jgi:hypothetical protein